MLPQTECYKFTDILEKVATNFTVEMLLLYTEGYGNIFFRDISNFPSTNTDTFQDMFFISTTLTISKLTLIRRLQRMPTVTSQHENNGDYHYDNDNCDVVFLRVNNYVYNDTQLGSEFCESV
jgi:hypothetical protein